MAVRSSMHQGAVSCSRTLAADDGYRGHRIDTGNGHRATFVDHRGKTLQTVLSKLQLWRAYYHCEDCELDIVSTLLLSRVRRLMGRVGSKEPFNEGRKDLDELAGKRGPHQGGRAGLRDPW